VKTERNVPNKMENIIHGNENEIFLVVNITHSGDLNVPKKESEKVLKYKDFTIEIQLL
jgi:hypothetical protein